MDLTLTVEQQDIVAAFETFFAKESPPDRVRAAEPLGFDVDLWHAVVDVGAIGVAVPTDLGGGGGSLLDAALIAEQYGRRLAPVPLVEVSVAARALAAAGAHDHLQALLAGDLLVAVSPRSTRDGVARLVPGAAVAGALLVVHDGALVLAELDSPPPVLADLGATALADVVLGEARAVHELAAGERAAALAAVIADEWRVLRAAALVGLAAEALAVAVRYAIQREQFGKPIGAFQAIAHPLADAATAVDGARLLAYEAAWAADAHETSAPSFASMAAAFAAHTAERTTAVALHTHGGYGFMLEYDPQLYYRRARAWTLTHAPVRGELRRLADALWPRDAGGSRPARQEA